MESLFAEKKLSASFPKKFPLFITFFLSSHINTFVMNVLILGSGGREHALAWKIAQSPMLTNLFIAPGNAGTGLCGINLPLDTNDFQAVKEVVVKHDIRLVIVGPEVPLVAGIHDFFLSDTQLKYIPVIGPAKMGAMLEGSKDFAKDFMIKYNIPTAAYRSFTTETLAEGFRFLGSLKPPYVLKADGLAAGKGVVILNDLDEARAELQEMLSGKFGKAGSTVVIEEFLSGIECSVFVLTDGNDFLILPEAKDYKRIGEGDTGLNTGGMGAVSPVPFADAVFMEKVERRIIIPTINGLKKEGIFYRGFIFLGLIKVDGEPVVIEYNARMGDPETEVVMPRIKNDFLEVLVACGNGEIKSQNIITDERTVCTVMMVARGYPGDYEKGKAITGFKKIKDSIVFHAGTKKSGNEIVTNGGRVLAVTSYGKDMAEALKKSYKNIELLEFEGRYWRQDIGRDLIK
jgi:phosphoribosylamine--glycine ligase